MEKIINIRDLGGLVNIQGQRICTGKLFRSANPSVGTINDYVQLQKLKLKEVIDFRSEQEKSHNEQRFAQQFNWVAKPIFTGNLIELIDNQLDRKKAKFIMCEIYRRFPIDFKKQFRYLLKLAEQGQIFLYHCTAGKDRTGFATFLLLSALGVDKEIIMKDYLLSNKAVALLKQQLAEFSKQVVLDAETWDALLSVNPDYLESSIAIINEQYGGISRYLTDVLAIDVRSIRQHYLED